MHEVLWDHRGGALSYLWEFRDTWLESTRPKRCEEHDRQREQWEQRLTIKPQVFTDREGI